MRKLTDTEEKAYAVLQRNGSVLLNNFDAQPITHFMLKEVFDSLVKKKRAVVEVTDGGNRYHAT